MSTNTMAATPKPTACGSTEALKPVITLSSSSRCSRAWAVDLETLTAEARSVSEILASWRSDAIMARSTLSIWRGNALRRW